MTKWAVSCFTKKPIMVMTIPNGKVQELMITILPGTIARRNCMLKTNSKIKWTNIYSWTTDRQRGHFCICNVAMVWIVSGIPKGITGGGRPAHNSNDAEEASQNTTLGIRRGWICGATDFQLEQIEGCLRSNPRWDILYRARITKRNAWSLSWHKPNTQRHTRRSCIILRSISGHLRYNRYSKLANRLKHFS